MAQEEKKDFFGRRPNKFWRAIKNMTLIASIILGNAGIFTIVLFEKIVAGIFVGVMALVMAIIYLAIDEKFY